MAPEPLSAAIRSPQRPRTSPSSAPLPLGAPSPPRLLSAPVSGSREPRAARGDHVLTEGGGRRRHGGRRRGARLGSSPGAARGAAAAAGRRASDGEEEQELEEEPPPPGNLGPGARPAVGPLRPRWRPARPLAPWRRPGRWVDRAACPRPPGQRRRLEEAGEGQGHGLPPPCFHLGLARCGRGPGLWEGGSAPLVYRPSITRGWTRRLPATSLPPDPPLPHPFLPPPGGGGVRGDLPARGSAPVDAGPSPQVGLVSKLASRSPGRFRSCPAGVAPVAAISVVREDRGVGRVTGGLAELQLARRWAAPLAPRNGLGCSAPVIFSAVARCGAFHRQKGCNEYLREAQGTGR